MLVAIFGLGVLAAGEQRSMRRKRLEDYLESSHATGDWFGLRDRADDVGVEFRGTWKGTFYGITAGGLDSPHGAFDEELTLGMRLDFGRMIGIEGLRAEGAVRYRDGRDPNRYVGASSTFGPSKYRSGLGWRMMPFFLTYTTPELFNAKEFLTISGGWQNAYTIFANQPLSKFFMNNSISATKGLGGLNGFPWSSSYAAWGGYVKVKPVEWQYTMAGLYMAIPSATDPDNHGLDFAGFAANPNADGLFFLAETGVTPKLGPEKLPGKYAFGAIYWGLENRGFDGETYDQKFAFYWQADQMLFREKSGASEGLNAITFFTYAPSYDNKLPFYFHAGLVYEGLIPGRDKDQCGIAFSYGSFSHDQIVADEARGVVPQTYEAVIEADYRVQATGFLYVQPFWQYIVRPGGRGEVSNANVLGFHCGIEF